MSHEISNVFVPVIVTNKRIPELVLEDINKNMSFMFKNNNFIFVGNSNISNVHLCVCVFTSIHLEGFICLGLEVQGTDQRCCVEDVIFLCQVPSSILQFESPNLSN